MKKKSCSFDEYGYYGENNGPISDTYPYMPKEDDPCDEMIPVHKPKDKDNE
jgi:hypothetical protein